MYVSVVGKKPPSYSSVDSRLKYDFICFPLFIELINMLNKIFYHVHNYAVVFINLKCNICVCYNICDHPPRNWCKVAPGSFSVYVISNLESICPKL